MAHAHGRFRTARGSRLAVAAFSGLLLVGSMALAVSASDRPPQRFPAGVASVGVPAGWVLQPGVGPSPMQHGAGESTQPTRTLVDPQRPSRELRFLPLTLAAPAADLERSGAGGLAPDRILRSTFHMLTGVRLPPRSRIEAEPVGDTGLEMATFIGRFQRPVLAVDAATGRTRPVVEVGLTAVAVVVDPRRTNRLTALVLSDRVFHWEDPAERLRQHGEAFVEILRALGPAATS